MKDSNEAKWLENAYEHIIGWAEGMIKNKSQNKGYIFAGFLGAIGGGIVGAIATKAVPKMMAGMMRNMMERKGKDGCNPARI